MNPRTKAVDTKATTAAEFLTGATPAPVLQPPAAAEAASAPVPEPESGPIPTDVATPTIATPTPAPVPEKAEPATQANPFTLLWKSPTGTASVRAMEVPGGCVVSHAIGWAGGAAEALCFVPNVKIEAGRLVDA